jgi:hypothetical protein
LLLPTCRANDPELLKRRAADKAELDAKVQQMLKENPGTVPSKWDRQRCMQVRPRPSVHAMQCINPALTQNQQISATVTVAHSAATRQTVLPCNQLPADGPLLPGGGQALHHVG